MPAQLRPSEGHFECARWRSCVAAMYIRPHVAVLPRASSQGLPGLSKIGVAMQPFPCSLALAWALTTEEGLHRTSSDIMASTIASTSQSSGGSSAVGSASASASASTSTTVAPFTSFSSYIDSRILRALSSLGYTHPTPVQSHVFPLAISENKDILARARTGSGKTYAYAIPAIQKIINVRKALDGGFTGNEDWLATRVLILVPTRELAEQVASHIRLLCGALREQDEIRIANIAGGAGAAGTSKGASDKTQRWVCVTCVHLHSTFSLMVPPTRADSLWPTDPTLSLPHLRGPWYTYELERCSSTSSNASSLTRQISSCRMATRPTIFAPSCLVVPARARAPWHRQHQRQPEGGHCRPCTSHSSCRPP